MVIVRHVVISSHVVISLSRCNWKSRSKSYPTEGEQFEHSQFSLQPVQPVGRQPVVSSVVGTHSGAQSSTRGVEENCLRPSPGKCLPKKRTVFGRRLAVACRRTEPSAVVVWQLLAEEENFRRSLDSGRTDIEPCFFRGGSLDLKWAPSSTSDFA